jgi:uncharacterized protein
MKTIGSLPVLQLVLLLASAPVLAADASGRYDATAVTSGRGEANRIHGYAQCLEDVLVKVTGDTSLIGDERIKALANGAAAYVDSFKYRDFYEGRALHDEQGSYDRPHYLTVSFSAEAIDKIVASLGKTVWHAPRPPVLVVLNVKTKTEAFVLTDAGNQERARDMRASLTNAIRRSGLEARLVAFQDIYALRGQLANSSFVAKLLKEDGTRKILFGALEWNNTKGSWDCNWRLEGKDKHAATSVWQVGGVTFDDAFRNGLYATLALLSGKAVDGLGRMN